MATGFRAVRRGDAGSWRPRTPLLVAGAGSVASALAAAMLNAVIPVLGAVLMFQALALAGLAAVLRPRSTTSG